MEVKLKIKNKLYRGVEDISIDKSMQSIANSFSMNIFKGDTVDITNNDLIRILVDDEVFFTGYIDSYNLGIGDKKKPLLLAGRSKAMDLVDCNVLQNKQYNKQTILQIIKDIITPFDITVSSSLTLEPLETFNSKIGETYFTAINRLCKQTNTLPISKKDGNIELVKNQKTKSKKILRDGDFKELNFIQSFPSRFSQYTYKKETAVVNIQDGVIQDEDIERFRPFVATNNEDKTNEDLANWKKNNDIANSIALTGIVVGWDLEINEIVKVETDIVNNSFLIKDIQYERSNNGTISHITFVDKDLFDV